MINLHPRVKQLVDKTDHIRKEMWKAPDRAQKRSIAWSYASLRVLAVTWIGMRENRLVSRAAALSFSSLIGLFPLVAITVLISGIVLDKTDPDFAVNKIYEAIEYIAPQVQLSSSDDPGTNEQADEIKAFMQKFIASSQSGAVGIAGMISIILIVIQLFVTIEDAFNDIWGVGRGRSWVTRIFVYWSIISLGSLVSFAGIALISIQKERMSRLAQYVPSQLDWIAIYGQSLITLTLIVTVLAIFYRFIPNTIVTWKASFIGGIFALACLIGNNALAFMYFQRIALTKSLYGSLSIIPILMLGLFVFWLILLLGGRMTFAVQNARFRSNKIDWNELSKESQESICLLVFIKLCRRFKKCQSPLSAYEIADKASLPIQIINASLGELRAIGLAVLVDTKDEGRFNGYKFQPAKPLEKVDLVLFKQAFERNGNTPDIQQYDSYDEILKHYHTLTRQALGESLGSANIDELIEQFGETSPSRARTT